MKKVAIMFCGYVALVYGMHLYGQQQSETVTMSKMSNGGPELQLQEAQQDKLDSNNKDLVILKLEYEAANAKQQQLSALFNSKQVDINEIVKKIKVENKWGDDVIYDSQKTKFIKVQPPAPPRVSLKNSKPDTPTKAPAPEIKK